MGKIIMPVNTKISVSTFQNIDGSNFTTAGIDAGVNVGKGSLGIYGGVGTNFTQGSTGAIIDFKGSMPYGDTPLSGGFRVRNNINGNSQTVQIRVQPATVNIPVSENTKVYATPYSATKINYKTGDTNTTFGAFGGVSTKVGNASIFVEGQMYDVTKVNKSTIGLNAGVSIPF